MITGSVRKPAKSGRTRTKPVIKEGRAAQAGA
jgi:hypothetical protein